MRWEGGENSGEDGRPQWVTLTAPLQFPLPLSVGGNRGGWGPSDGRAESECVTRVFILRALTGIWQRPRRGGLPVQVVKECPSGVL